MVEEAWPIRIVPDAIGLLIKGISCRGSGSWAENLFHRVLMSVEKRYQGENRCNHADVVKHRLF